MKRAALTLGLALLAPPAAAQWLGEPSWNNPTAGSGFTIYGDYSRPNSNAGGGTAIGGSLIPVAVNLQLGGGHSFEITSATTTLPLQTMLHAAVGLSVPLPTPVVSIEPFVSPGIRYHHYSNVAPGAPDHEVHFGWVIGGVVGVGPIGIHVDN